jgi:hydrogenase nickel incorporation protein HypA/HybF
MHELSIAEAIVDVAERHAEGRTVARVDVRVGYLRQVVPDALSFAFTLLASGTELEGAELHITHVPAGGRCRACGRESAFEELPLACAHCESLDVELTTGEELCVEALEVEQETPTKERIGHGSHL